MKTPALAGFGGTITARLARIPRRTWLMLGVTMLLLFALTVWAAIALLSHAWSTGNAWIDRSSQAAAVLLPDAQQRIDTVAPELRDTLDRGRAALAAVAPETSKRLDTVAPELRDTFDRGRAALAAVAPETSKRLEVAIPGVAAVAGIGGAAAILAGDVVGEDPVGVPRHPALTRTGYALADGARDVTYAGPAPFAEVLAFYRQPLLAGGYTERVTASSPSGATVEYRKGEQGLTLTVTAKGDAASEVRIVEH